MAKALIVSYGLSAVSDNTNVYRALFGSRNAGGVEAENETYIRRAGTIADFFCYVPSNTVSASSTVTLRKSQASTAITVTYTSDQTGLKEDLSNSVSYAATDEADYLISCPNESGTNTLSLQIIGCTFAADADTVCFLGTNGANSAINTASATRFHPVCGSNDANATESTVTFRMRAAFTLTNFAVYLITNSRTTDTVFKTRKNTADGAASVTYTSGQTGQKEDISNTDTVAAGDDICFASVTSTGTETLTTRGFSLSLVSTAAQFLLPTYGAAAGVTFAFNTTAFSGVGAHVESNGTEADTEAYCKHAFLLKELTVKISTNTIATDPSTVTLRKNRADTALTVSIPAGSTTLVSDSVNSVSIESGDEIDFEISTPNTSGNLVLRQCSLIGEIASSPTGSAGLMSMGVGA